jgi:hypothetical protein
MTGPAAHNDGGIERVYEWQGSCCSRTTEVIEVLLRFTESIRLNVFGRVYEYGRGEVHRVPLAMVGLLLAEGCVETPGPAAAEQVA